MSKSTCVAVLLSTGLHKFSLSATGWEGRRNSFSMYRNSGIAFLLTCPSKWTEEWLPTHEPTCKCGAVLPSIGLHDFSLSTISSISWPANTGGSWNTVWETLRDIDKQMRIQQTDWTEIWTWDSPASPSLMCTRSPILTVIIELYQQTF